MEHIFEQYGDTILAVIAAGAIITIASFFVFGNGTEMGVLGQFIYDSLSSVMQ